jgi:hypothetical protein
MGSIQTVALDCCLVEFTQVVEPERRGRAACFLQKKKKKKKMAPSAMGFRPHCCISTTGQHVED